MSRHVLVVEDEATLLRGILRTLDPVLEVRTTGCSTVDEAVGILDRDPPDLVITDINLPGRFGLELVGELDARKLHVPIVVITAYSAVYQAQIPKHRDITVLEKPFSMGVLRELLEERLGPPRGGRSPETQPFQLSDYLQLAGLGKYSVVLAIEAEGGADGRVEIVDGEVWNAHWEELSGEEALAALLAQTEQTVRVRSLSERPTERQIERGLQEVMLDLVRQHDENRRDTVALNLAELGIATRDTATEVGAPAPSAPAAASTPPPSPTTVDSGEVEFERLFAEGMEAALARDYPRAAEAFRKAQKLRPGDPRVRFNLERVLSRLSGEQASR